MRYLIDTNIVLFVLTDQEQLTRETEDILNDYNNQIYVPAEAIKELIHLYQSGKLEVRKWKIARDIVDFIKDANFEIKSPREEHLKTLADLPLLPDHKDPSDRMIIAQAITENIPIISSDRKFINYREFGLELIFNKRGRAT